MKQKKKETRKTRQALRRDRLITAIAQVKSRLELMPIVFRTVEFKSKLNPPTEEFQNRAFFQCFVELVNELQDSADAFKCFCDCCPYPEDEETVKPKLKPKIKSINELESLAQTDKWYENLALTASENLGGGTRDLKQSLQWLRTNAMETDEKGVVNEINFCRDLVRCDDASPAT